MKVLDRKLTDRFLTRLFLALMVFAGGCSHKNPTAAPVTPSGDARISKCELFPGELKRIEPHLGLTGSCVKINYRGPDRITLKAEVWQDGKFARQVGNLMAGLTPPGEASFSVKKVTDPKGNEKFQLVDVLSHKDGYVSSRGYVDVPELKGVEKLQGTIDLAEPVELSKDKPVAVWGLVAGNGANKRQAGESIEDVAKRVEWALIFKVGLETEQELDGAR